MTEVLDDIAEDAVFDSSGDVFADLDIQLSEDDMLKIEISRAIAARLRQRKLTQADAAKIVGTDQAKISALLRGRLRGFSVNRLFDYLLKLGFDIDIRLSGNGSAAKGRVKVSRAA